MIIKKENYTISFGVDFSDELYQFEVESKGCLFNVIVTLKNGQQYKLNFYDPIRIKQDIDAELEAGYSCFYEENAIVVKKVVLKEMINSIEFIYNKNISRLGSCLSKPKH